jgi:hypothetical protein
MTTGGFIKKTLIPVLVIGLYGTFGFSGVSAGTTQPGADFKISDLVLPAEVGAGENFTISATIANSATNDGDYEATLKINGVKEGAKAVNVPPKGVRAVSFNVTLSESGVYEVDLDGLTGSLTVTSKPPAQAVAGGARPWLIAAVSSAAAIALLAAFWIISRRRTHMKRGAG